jgi:hypothetical protein
VLALIRWLRAKRGRTVPVRGHRDVGGTLCPGDTIHTWIRAGLPDPEGDDTQLTDKVGLGTGTRAVLQQITGTEITEMEVGDLLQRVLGNVLALANRPAVDVEALAEQLSRETDAATIAAALREVLPEVKVTLGGQSPAEH